MNEQEARELRKENADLKRRIGELEQLLNVAPSSNAKAVASAPRSGRRTENGDAGSAPAGATPLISEMLVGEDLYEAIKRRLQAEAPALLKVLTMKPELNVEVRRQVVTADGSSWLGRAASLIAEGFMDSPRRSIDVFREATRLGATGVAPRADEACKKLLAMGFLTRESDGFQAVPGMKVNIVEMEPAG